MNRSLKGGIAEWEETGRRRFPETTLAVGSKMILYLDFWEEKSQRKGCEDVQKFSNQFGMGEGVCEMQ